MTNTKYTIREMLMDNKEITEFLLQGKENTYANVKELFGTKIFDYPKLLDNETNVSTYIRFDVGEHERGGINTKYAYIIIDMHKDIIHTNGNVNNLDMIADKVVEDIKKTFDERIKRIDNTFGKCGDNKYFHERVINFALENTKGHEDICNSNEILNIVMLGCFEN